MESIQFIGRIFSPPKNLRDCPLQENEGAPAASLKINKKYQKALSGLTVGDKILLFT